MWLVANIRFLWTQDHQEYLEHEANIIVKKRNSFHWALILFYAVNS